MSTATAPQGVMLPCRCGRTGAHSCNGHRITPVQIKPPRTTSPNTEEADRG